MVQADEMRDMVEIGENLRKARECAGMSQQELGQEFGGNAATIYRYEIGNQNMTVKRLCQMADILHVSPLEILPGRYTADRNGELDSIAHRINAMPAETKVKAIEMIGVMLDGLLWQCGQLKMDA